MDFEYSRMIGIVVARGRWCPTKLYHDCAYCVAVDLPQSLRVERLTNLVIANDSEPGDRYEKWRRSSEYDKLREP